jgi:D-3-phosphoglycerate dehydrogenase
MKVLLSPSSFGQISKEPLELLTSKGLEFINNPYGRKLTEDEVIALGTNCVGIVAGVEPLTEKVMRAIPTLKCISRVGVGIDNVDVESARILGIHVVNTPDGPTQAVAEMTLGMALALLRNIPQAHYEMKNKQWKKFVGNLLQDKTIGIIGLGRIGKKVAGMFRSLGNPVIGFDLYPDAAWADNYNVEYVEMSHLLQRADIISLHVSGNGNGGPVIGIEEFSVIKKGSLLINLSRGGVVDEQALHTALLKGDIAGAAIDVFSEEPYSGPLCDMENVVLTPHLGSYAEEGKLQMEKDAVKNLLEKLLK